MNALLSKVSSPFIFSKITVLKLMQFKKQSEPINVTKFGIVMDDRRVHPLKQSVPNEVTKFGIAM
jgi:hypothetical protein